MKLKFVINSLLLFLLIHTCWLAIIVQARSNHHHSHPHGDDDQSKSHRSRNIWGSLPTSSERWKFMALLKIRLLKKNTVGFCSAILINNRSLLTAAHCLENYTFTKPIEVLFKGKSFKTIDRNKDQDILYKTTSFKIYEKYWDHIDEEKQKQQYDIAIVKLEKPIVLDPQRGIDRVDLPIGPDGRQYPFDPNTCYLVAYGQEMPAYPDHRLQQVKMRILPKKICKGAAVDIERQICYGYVRKPLPGIIPKAGAQGDSGGAFLCKTMHFHTGGKHRKLPRYVLISMNTAQAEGNEYQDYFTMGVRITKYMDWIRQNS